MQIELFEYIKSLKPVYGYAGNDNDRLTPEDLETLKAGGQVVKHGKESGCSFYFSTPYNNAVRLIYSICNGYLNDKEEPTPGRDARYYGFLFNDRLFVNNQAIAEKYIEDVNAAILEIVPDEQTAARKWEERQCKSEYEVNNVNMYMEIDYTPDARKCFYDGAEPVLSLYHTEQKSISLREIIKYIQSPDETITAEAENYVKGHTREIYISYFRHNKTVAALKAIKNDPDRAEHMILKISKCVTTQKTVRIELVTGQEVRAEASAIKYLCHRDVISNYYVIAADRDKLPKNEYNRPEDININQIKAIKHGGKVLYAA